VHLCDVLSVKGIRNVILHEPLSDIRPVISLQFALSAPQSEIWRGLNNAAVVRANLRQDRHRGERRRRSAQCRYRVLVARPSVTAP
jgi:hypothetical protein